MQGAQVVMASFSRETFIQASVEMIQALCERALG